VLVLLKVTWPVWLQPSLIAPTTQKESGWHDRAPPRAPSVG
jgi:hypothetical protein